MPSVWPEDQTPTEAINCSRCELHCQRSRIIWGEGNPTGPVIIVLDNPGAREDKDGNSFICGTRQTLQSAAFEAGFKMEDLYVTYILKCRPVRRYNKEAARSTCISYLNKQLELQNPKLAMCLGTTAVQYFFENMEAEVKNLRGQMHFVRGLPAYVSYHPLAVRRRPNLSKQFSEDWNLLSRHFFSLFPDKKEL